MSPEVQSAEKKRQITREGVVIGDKMHKTIIVEITRTLMHSQFKKIVKRRIRYAAHDEENQAKLGDKVLIIQTRPLSKTKRWKLVKVL